MLFKIVLVVAVLAFAVDSASKDIRSKVDYQNGREPRIYENKIKAAIQKLLEKLKNEGIPSKNISSLDPLNVKNFQTQLKNTLAKLDLNLTDSNFIGLTSVDIPTLSFQIAGMTFSIGLNWKTVQGQGTYSMKGTVIGLLPMHGRGDFDLEIKNFVVNASGKLGTDQNKFLHLEDFKVYVSVEKTDVWLSGLYDNEILSNFTSKLISTKLPGIVNKFKGTISMLLSPKIEKLGNEMLENKTINDIIGGLGL